MINLLIVWVCLADIYMCEHEHCLLNIANLIVFFTGDNFDLYFPWDVNEVGVRW